MYSLHTYLLAVVVLKLLIYYWSQFGRQVRSVLSFFKLFKILNGKKRKKKDLSPPLQALVCLFMLQWGKWTTQKHGWGVCTRIFVILKGVIKKIQSVSCSALIWGCVCAFVYTLLVFSNCVGQILLLVMVRHLSWLWWCHMSLTFFDQTWRPPCSKRMHMKYISLSSAGWLFKHG